MSSSVSVCDFMQTFYINNELFISSLLMKACPVSSKSTKKKKKRGKEKRNENGVIGLI